LVGVRILTEYLSPSAYGVLGLSLTIVALYTEVVIGGLIGAFTRFYSIAAKANDVNGYVRGVRTLLLLAAAIAVSLFLALTPLLLSGFEGLTLQMGLVVAVFAVLFGSNAALNAVLNGARRRSLVAFNSVVDAWLKIALAVLAIKLFGSSATSVLTAYAVSLSLVMLHQLYRVSQLREPGLVTAQQKWSHEMFTFAWPASVWGIFTWAQLVADRWSLQTFYSTAEVGLYSVVLQLGYFPMSLLLGMLGTFLTPIFFNRTNDRLQHIDQSQDAIWLRIFWGGIGVSALAALIAWGAKGLVFDLFTAEGFRAMSIYLPTMVLAGGLYGTASLLQVRLMAHMRMIPLAKIMITTALLGVGLTFSLASVWGIAGVVMAKFLFSLAYLAALAYVTIFYSQRS
jgi:O-antigen/teichoic acid export membrane protein